MSEFKFKFPDFKEISSMASKLYHGVKTSVGEIIVDYKQKRAAEEEQELAAAAKAAAEAAKNPAPAPAPVQAPDLAGSASATTPPEDKIKPAASKNEKETTVKDKSS